MFFAHIFFLALEFVLYDFLITLIAQELLLAWMNYQAYMTFSTTFIYLYLVFLMVCAVVGVFHFLSVGLGLSVLAFIGQCALYAFGSY